MERGSIALIGGTEETVPREDIFRSLLAAYGDEPSEVLVLAAASHFEREPQRYVDLLEELGAKARLIFIEKRSDGENSEYLRAMENADAMLLTGANHLRLTTNLGGTSLAKAMRRRNGEGMHIAGTAAGAAYICAHMITYGNVGVTPRAGRVTLTPGLGLLNSLIVDPQVHRQGLGRLMTSLAYNPFAIGLGLEDSSAALIDAKYDLQVLGEGAVTLLDPSELEYSSIDEARAEEPVCMIGLKLHVLTPGTVYNLKTHTAVTAADQPKRGVTRPSSWMG